MKSNSFVDLIYLLIYLLIESFFSSACKLAIASQNDSALIFSYLQGSQPSILIDMCEFQISILNIVNLSCCVLCEFIKFSYAPIHKTLFYMN